MMMNRGPREYDESAAKNQRNCENERRLAEQRKAKHAIDVSRQTAVSCGVGVGAPELKSGFFLEQMNGFLVY